MSHLDERKEKNCLNCGTVVHGRYCHVCGQQNLEPKESFWHLVSHFFADITHFDGKFFTTVKDLLFKPGFLSKEYLKGRRMSYLDPIRMYVFTSAVFFLIFFSFIYSDHGTNITSTVNGKTLSQIAVMDSAEFAVFTSNINKEDEKAAQPMTRAEFQSYLDSSVFGHGLHFTKTHYRSKAHYDSVLASGEKKHNWIERQLIYKEIAINEKYKNDTRQIFDAFKNTLIHSLPQMLFVSLPLLALILKLIYIRRRKQFYYVSHSIFSLHLYIFLFLAMLILFGLNRINDFLHWGFLGTLIGFLIFGLFVYEYLAMKNFYQQGWWKTFFKFIIINLLLVVVISLLFVVFIFFSFFKI